MKPLLKVFVCLIIILGSLTIGTNQAFAWVKIELLPAVVAADGTSTVEVTAVAKDPNGNPLVGHTVNFSLVSPVPPVGSLSSSSATTDSSGKAVTTYQSSTTPAKVIIQAQINVNVQPPFNPPWGDQTFTNTGIIYALKAEIKSLEFTADHGLLKKTPEGNEWGDSSTSFEKPEWVKGSTEINPISQTKGTPVPIKIIIKVEPADVSFNLFGNSTGLNSSYWSSGNTSTGSEQSIEFPAPNGLLPNYVSTATGNITWSLSIPGATDMVLDPTGPHKVYVTYGEPGGSAVTERRVEWVCSTAYNLSMPHDCVAAIHQAVGRYNVNAEPADPLWKIAGGVSAQCDDISNFYKLATEMLGISPSGTVVYVYPKPSKTSKETTGDTDNEIRTISVLNHPIDTTHDDLIVDEKLGFQDYAQGWNNFEACFKFSSGGVTKYYAGGAGIYNTALETMVSVCDFTSWLYMSSIVGPEWTKCENPGPYPVDNWP